MVSLHTSGLTMDALTTFQIIKKKKKEKNVELLSLVSNLSSFPRYR
jgi:hypothetical protein